MGADLAGTSSPYVSPSFSALFLFRCNIIFTKWKLLKKKTKNKQNKQKKKNR